MHRKEKSENQIKSSLLKSFEIAQGLKRHAALILASRIFPRKQLFFFKGYFSVETPSQLSLSLIHSDQSSPASSTPGK